MLCGGAQLTLGDMEEVCTSARRSLAYQSTLTLLNFGRYTVSNGYTSPQFPPQERKFDWRGWHLGPSDAAQCQKKIFVTCHFNEGILNTTHQRRTCRKSDQYNAVRHSFCKSIHLQVIPCSRVSTHNWKLCHFSHVGEVTARRRHPSCHQADLCAYVSAVSSRSLTADVA